MKVIELIRELESYSCNRSDVKIELSIAIEGTNIVHEHWSEILGVRLGKDGRSLIIEGKSVQ